MTKDEATALNAMYGNNPNIRYTEFASQAYVAEVAEAIGKPITVNGRTAIIRDVIPVPGDKYQVVVELCEPPEG